MTLIRLTPDTAAASVTIIIYISALVRFVVLLGLSVNFVVCSRFTLICIKELSAENSQDQLLNNNPCLHSSFTNYRDYNLQYDTRGYQFPDLSRFALRKIF